MIQEFLDVCNSYNHPPLHLLLQFSNTSNFYTGEDTGAVQTEFFLLPEKAYMRFGEFEQIVEDSNALLISNNLHQMILYRNARSVIEKMKDSYELKASKTNAKKVLETFNIQRLTNLENGIGLILSSKKMLIKTNLPIETIYLQYDAQTRTPKSVLHTQRLLVPLSANEFAALRSKETEKDIMIDSVGNHYFIKEQRLAYQYLLVQHDAAIKIPVRLQDRVYLTASGTYLPLEAYKQYRIDVEN